MIERCVAYCDEPRPERIVWTLVTWRAFLYYLLGICEIVQLAVLVYVYGPLIGLSIVLASTAALWLFGSRLGLRRRSSVCDRLSN